MIRGYYFITDSALSRAGVLDDVSLAVKCGVGAVQYREKNASTKILFEEASRLREICRNAALIINDRIDIALAVSADGAHIGGDDMPLTEARRLLGKDKIIGVTVHNEDEAREAEALGADYLGISPVFATSTKKDAGAACGLELIKRIRSFSKLPLAAIGGINFDNAREVISAGADALCAISAVASSSDPAGAIGRFQKLFQSAPGF
ncbi:MAG: thiamine phosphate synthase [Elusimicrobiota bacterium]|nr:thiamine phosphate synthase [Elusimicrobiota bacterium]